MPKLDKHIYPSVHRGIVRAALLTLEQESNPAARRYPAELAAVLIEEAAAPDRIGDRQQGRGLHYYCAVKPDGTALKPHSVMQGYVNGTRALPRRQKGRLYAEPFPCAAYARRYLLPAACLRDDLFFEICLCAQAL